MKPSRRPRSAGCTVFACSTHSKASRVVMCSAWCSSMNATNRGSTRLASCILKPRLRRSARYSCNASRKVFIAHLPATAWLRNAGHRYPLERRSKCFVGFDGAALRRSRAATRLLAACALPRRAGTDVNRGAVRQPERVAAHSAQSCQWHLASVRGSALLTAGINVGPCSWAAPAADRQRWPRPHQLHRQQLLTSILAAQSQVTAVPVADFELQRDDLVSA